MTQSNPPFARATKCDVPGPLALDVPVLHRDTALKKCPELSAFVRNCPEVSGNCWPNLPPSPSAAQAPSPLCLRPFVPFPAM